MNTSNPWIDVVSVENVPPEPVRHHSSATVNIKEERRCLAEIRAIGATIPFHYVLSNGQKATDFALQYILRHHLKRKAKTEDVRHDTISGTHTRETTTKNGSQ